MTTFLSLNKEKRKVYLNHPLILNQMNIEIAKKPMSPKTRKYPLLNFKNMPELNWNSGYFLVLGLIEIAKKPMSPKTRKYPLFQFNSGMFLKFIPYTPAIKVSGVK